MATNLKNLSSNPKVNQPSAKKMHISIVVSEWNTEITAALLKGAVDTLINNGVSEKNISTSWVPGSFELPMGAQLVAEYKKTDAIICLGCVIQGETRHFDFICDAVANGITRVNLDYNIPVIFGVLTTNNQQQAIDRSGGKHGNKGDEAAYTAIKMAELKQKLKNKSSLE